MRWRIAKAIELTRKESVCELTAALCGKKWKQGEKL
jgi:hypothetical protein